MKRITLVVLSVVMPLSSSFASTCAAKIDNALCQQMASLAQSSSLIPIEILLPEPPFSYPNKMEVSVDSARNYSLMVQDSLSRHLKAIEPQIDSLFVKYVLLSISTGQRISPPNISYDYFLDVKASVATINQLAQENLVARIDLFSAPGVPTGMPALTILAMQFPFDTVLAGLITDNGTLLADTVVIARYGMKFKFGPLSTSLVCCPQDIAFDFGVSTLKDNRFPQDGTTLLSGGSYDGSVCSPPCTSYVNIDSSYKTHEYRFPLADPLGHVLYMKVMDGSRPDSIRVRFDTVSFLTNTSISVRSSVTNSGKIAVAFDKNFVTVYGLDNARIAIYDVSGRKLFSSILNSKDSRIPLPALSKPGVFVVKVTSGREELVIKKCMVR